VPNPARVLLECYTDDEDDEDEDEGASETQKDEGHLTTKKGNRVLSYLIRAWK
jgi:hypothetical protein